MINKPTVTHKILIIEDNDDTAKAEQDTFETLGFQVMRVSREEEVEIAVNSFKPHLIILDIDLQGKKAGFQIANDSLKNPNSTEVPIVIYSVHMEDLASGDVKDDSGAWSEFHSQFNIEPIVVNRKDEEDSLLALIVAVCKQFRRIYGGVPIEAQEFLEAKVPNYWED